MEEMNKAQVVTWLLNQSPAMVVLLALSYVLWTQNERSREENKACNQEIIKIYQSQNDRMITALEKIEYYIQTTTEHGKEEEKSRKKK